MSQNLRNQGILKLGCCAALIFFLSGAALAQSPGKIPPEVIDQTAAHGSASVLVGLDLPWQMESSLSQDDLRAQRSTIAAGQDELLDQLAGRKFTVVRRYQEIPGIALEVGAEALAELARLPIVTNVLLDRRTDRRAAANQSRHSAWRTGFHISHQRKSTFQSLHPRRPRRHRSGARRIKNAVATRRFIERQTGRLATQRHPRRAELRPRRARRDAL